MADTQTPSNAQLATAGLVPVLVLRKHRPVGGAFEAGTILPQPAANTITEIIPIGGQFKGKLRGKFTDGGTLSFRYRRPAVSPDAVGTSYDSALSPPCADVAVVANTEFETDDIEPTGESNLAVKWTSDASGPATVTFFDQMWL